MDLHEEALVFNDRYDYWMTIAKVEQPEWTPEKLREKCLELAFMNRAQRRANKLKYPPAKTYMKARTPYGGVLVFDFEKFVENLQRVVASTSSPELDKP